MALFKKKKEVRKEIPSLPPLPKLPKLPELEEEEEKDPISKLPSFPSNSLGTKFSNNTIKHAVAGEKEEEPFADDFLDEDDIRMMQEPPRRPSIMEVREGAPKKSKSTKFKGEVDTTEPIFIRIDRFEEALRIFNETKKKMSNIERILEEVKRIKEKEEGELKTWENEIRSMKEQIEKVDRDIFSKI